VAPKRAFPWRPALIVAAVAGLTVLTRLLPAERWLTALQHWVERLGPWGYLAYGAVYVVTVQERRRVHRDEIDITARAVSDVTDELVRERAIA